MDGFELPEDETVTTQDLDKAIQEVWDAQQELELIKQKQKAAFRIYADKEMRLAALLELAKKNDYLLEGVARVKVKDRTSYKVPDSTENKLKFFAFLTEFYGKEFTDSVISINSQKLQTIVKNITEDLREQGKSVEIDGLEAPITTKTLSITRVR